METVNTQPELTNEEPNDVEDGKLIAIISYITIIGLIIAFVMNQNKQNSFAKFHIRQALGIFLIGLLSYVFGRVVPSIGWILNLLISLPLFILWIIGLINAISGNRKELPIVGQHFSEWFKNI